MTIVSPQPTRRSPAASLDWLGRPWLPGASQSLLTSLLELQAYSARRSRPRLRIELATKDQMEVVLGLIRDAASWLAEAKDTRQWQKPWPNEKERDERVRNGLERQKTWIVWDGDKPAATATLATGPNQEVWSAGECDLAERAVYVHRLITARDYAGRGLGAQLIDWAGLRARREYGAKWIRIDVWTDNFGLHGYYLGIGFKPCGLSAKPGYPSGALFQKGISMIAAPATPLFRE